MESSPHQKNLHRYAVACLTSPLAARRFSALSQSFPGMGRCPPDQEASQLGSTLTSVARTQERQLHSVANRNCSHTDTDNAPARESSRLGVACAPHAQPCKTVISSAMCHINDSFVHPLQGVFLRCCDTTSERCSILTPTFKSRHHKRDVFFRSAPYASAIISRLSERIPPQLVHGLLNNRVKQHQAAPQGHESHGSCCQAPPVHGA